MFCQKENKIKMLYDNLNSEEKLELIIKSLNNPDKKGLEILDVINTLKILSKINKNNIEEVYLKQKEAIRFLQLTINSLIKDSLLLQIIISTIVIEQYKLNPEEVKSLIQNIENLKEKLNELEEINTLSFLPKEVSTFIKNNNIIKM